MTTFHVAENRVVITWTPEGEPLGLISGKLHDVSPRGLEIDWLLRFPGTMSGVGAEMCAALLPLIVEHYRLSWVLVKISDSYKPAWLTAMARKFGFVFQERQGDLTVWRLDLP